MTTSKNVSRPGHEPDCTGGLCCEALCGRGLDPAVHGDRATRAEHALAAMTKERDTALERLAECERDLEAATRSCRLWQEDYYRSRRAMP